MLTGLIADIYVDPTQRRSGIGAALVERLRAWFAENDVPYYEWDMAAANADGQAFWRAVGGASCHATDAGECARRD